MRATGQQPLNAADRAMLTVDRILRGIGSSGFETQTFVWLSSRINAAALQTAIARLGQRYPVIAARLVETGANGPYWRFQPDAVCPLRETTLASAEPVA